ncbi:MAG: response regulator [Pseudomonadota bacterium]|nr:response regulator [Pseudomonadota bacterium]
MKRILFVDDEPAILEGLRNLLRSQRKVWQMSFAASGEEALQILAVEPYDVVVSDMRMPRMDGATLLRHVKERYPRVARIVLSGHTELESALRTVPFAHQFLGKPCDGECLRSVIQRTCDLQTLLHDENLRRRVGQITRLPSAPRVYVALTKALSDPEVSLREVAALIESDMAMSAKVLQVVNSAFFGLPRRLSNMLEAVSYLGMGVIKNLVLSVEAFRELRGGEAAKGFDFDRVQRQCFVTGRIAQRLLSNRHEAQDAFVAGTLHELGTLILATREPLEFAIVDAQALAREVPRHVVEREAGGVSHAEVGAYLIGLWGLPYGIAEAVAYHHDPMRTDPTRFGVVEAVHCAAALASEAIGLAGFHEPPEPRLLERLGLQHALPGWREIAREEACRVEV